MKQQPPPGRVGIDVGSRRRLLKATSRESSSAFVAPSGRGFPQLPGRKSSSRCEYRAFSKDSVASRCRDFLFDARADSLIEGAISRKMISEENDATNAGRFEDHRYSANY